MSNTIEIIKVSCAICVNNNRDFLAKRSKGKHLEGFWEFPGGKIENYEDPKDALVREIKEELEIKIEILDYFGSNTYSYDNKSIELISFLCNINTDLIKLNAHDEAGWFNKSELSKIKIAPADIPLLEKIKFY